MSSVFIYPISYDLGFAPNPFGGLCSLACCKPRIRQVAQAGDWIVGLTGTKLKPAMRCVFAMVVTGEETFDSYWANPVYAARRAKRNGSVKKLVGDNIYHRVSNNSPWIQEDSVHSLVDGQQCPLNTSHDTRINRILLSDKFIYFGSDAALPPKAIFRSLGYLKNARDYRRFDLAQARPLVRWLESQMALRPNEVISDPIDFNSSAKRFDARRRKMV